MEPVTTTYDYSGIASAVTTAATELVPIGITIMGIMVGISMIPRIVYKFL